MKEPKIKKYRLENNKGDKILIIDNMMTVTHNSKRDNYDLNLMQNCRNSKKPLDSPIVVIDNKGVLDLIIGDHSKSIYYDFNDKKTIKKLKKLFKSYIDPELDLSDIPVNSTREKPNPKGFKAKKNQLKIFKLIDMNSFTFDPTSSERIIVIGNLINQRNEKGSITYDLNLLNDFLENGNELKLIFLYPKNSIKEMIINISDQELRDQFKEFINYWISRNTY